MITVYILKNDKLDAHYTPFALDRVTVTCFHKDLYLPSTKQCEILGNLRMQTFSVYWYVEYAVESLSFLRFFAQSARSKCVTKARLCHSVRILQLRKQSESFDKTLARYSHESLAGVCKFVW